MPPAFPEPDGSSGAMEHSRDPWLSTDLKPITVAGPHGFKPISLFSAMAAPALFSASAIYPRFLRLSRWNSPMDKKKTGEDRRPWVHSFGE